MAARVPRPSMKLRLPPARPPRRDKLRGCYTARMLPLRLALSAFALLAALTPVHARPPLPPPAPCRICFYGPGNMAFDAAGNVYLADSDNKSRSRILKLSPDGRVLADWRVFSAAPGRVNGPDGIVLDHHGDILVVDCGGDQILKLSPRGQVLARFAGFPAHAFDVGGHVAVGLHGNIYGVAAGPGLVRKFSPSGRLLASWHRTSGPGADQWHQPETISVDASGNLFLLDFGNRRMLVLTPTGRTVRSFDDMPGEPLRLASTSGATVGPDGNIFIADYLLHRIQEFSPGGRLLATIGNRPGVVLFTQAPNGVAVDAHGDLYSADGLSVVKYSRHRQLLARWQ